MVELHGIGNGLAAILLALWALVVTLVSAGTWISIRRVGRLGAAASGDAQLPPVTILKPLKGAEPGLEENLRSFFRLDYPRYELIFSVAEWRDPAVRLVRRLLDEFPEAEARLIVGEVDVGPNPKVNNLVAGYERAGHDWLLISDSNVRVSPDALRRLASHLEPGVGLVTGVVVGRGGTGVGAALEAAYLGTYYARWMNVAARLGHPCVVGKCMLFRRSTAERFGGIRALGRYLAEDYMAGEAMRRLGEKVVIAADPVMQHLGEYPLGIFWSRHIRWGRIRKSQAGAAFLLEVWLSALFSGAMGAWAISELDLGISVRAFLIAHVSVWALCDALLLRVLEGKFHMRQPVGWLLRELIAIPLWLHTFAGNAVLWRGRRLTLLPGGVLEVPAVAVAVTEPPEVRVEGVA